MLQRNGRQPYTRSEANGLRRKVSNYIQHPPQRKYAHLGTRTPERKDVLE